MSVMGVKTMDKTQSVLREPLVYSISGLPYSPALLHSGPIPHTVPSLPCFSASLFSCEYTSFLLLEPYFDGVEIAGALRQEAN